MEWEQSLPKDNLERGPLHVWRTRLDDEVIAHTYYQRILSKDKKRASRFMFNKDRVRYVMARGILRLLLGYYLELPPAEINFTYSNFQKPFLINDPKLHFNISYSGYYDLFGFTRINELGVDLEVIQKGIAIEELTGKFLSANEAVVILRLVNHDRLKAFFTCWTRKEAFINSDGRGLSLPLDQFEVSNLDHEPVQTKRIQCCSEAIEQWNLFALSPAENTL